MNQIRQCCHCQSHYHVDLNEVARGISRWACPFCGQVTDFADAQLAKPNITPEASSFWAMVSALGIVAGLFVAANLADRALNRLTA
jgi:hypothetical protein